MVKLTSPRTSWFLALERSLVRQQICRTRLRAFSRRCSRSAIRGQLRRLSLKSAQPDVRLVLLLLARLGRNWASELAINLAKMGEFRAGFGRQKHENYGECDETRPCCPLSGISGCLARARFRASIYLVW